MTNLIHSSLGLGHACAATMAMLLGALVVLTNKGTLFHKRAGYAYVASMVLVNGTAFGIYHLYSRFGPFHVAALFSTVSILGGMIPALLRHRVNGWIYWHYFFMNWSVVGLYAAFWAEMLVRLLPVGHFWPVVVAATAGTTITGSVLIRRHAPRLLKMGSPAASAESQQALQ